MRTAAVRHDGHAAFRALEILELKTLPDVRLAVAVLYSYCFVTTACAKSHKKIAPAG